MVVVTSFSQKLYNEYAYRVVESFKNWPEEAKLVIYSENMEGESSDRIEWRDLSFPDLDQFKNACKPTDDYRYDAARFANKVWAMVHGSQDETGLVFWMDADCITHRKISADFLKRLIPPQTYLGSFQRKNYVETGFWGVRANHVCHKPFMTALKAVYTGGSIFNLLEWHDCFALDFVRQVMKVPSVNLTETLNGRGSHVMATSQLGKYIDHTKGPRKARGFSPECQWHRPAVLGDA